MAGIPVDSCIDDCDIGLDLWCSYVFLWCDGFQWDYRCLSVV